MKKLLSFVIALVMLFSMTFVCHANEVITVTISVYDSVNDEYIVSAVKSSVLEDSTVMSLLLDTVSSVDVIDGNVVSIAGVANNTNGYKWNYMVNSQKQEISSDLVLLKEGDVVEWVYQDTSIPETSITPTQENVTVTTATVSPLNTTSSTTKSVILDKTNSTDKSNKSEQDKSTETTTEEETESETTTKETKKDSFEKPTQTREISKDFNSTLAPALKYIEANNGKYTTVVLSLYDKKIPEYLKDSIKNSAQDNSLPLQEKIHLLLAISSIGENPEIFSSLELKKQIYNSTDLISYGLDNIVFSLLYAPYANLSGEELHSEEALIDLILQNQNTDGSFSKTYNTNGDVDITALTLVAFSKFQRYPSVALATDKALKWLSTQQNKDGSFNDANGVKNCISTAYVLMALSSLEMKVEEDNLIENSDNLFNALLMFFDGTAFTYQKNSTTSVDASEAVLLAVAAYQLQINPLSVDFNALYSNQSSFSITNLLVFSAAFVFVILLIYFKRKQGDKNG